MTTHIYAFGSICRGEIDGSSDIDLLACLTEPNKKIDPNKFSIYTYERLRELWMEGNPFSWHLHLESKMIHSSDGSNFLEELDEPSEYNKVDEDCNKFRNLFTESYLSLLESRNSMVFNLSCMFLATRNFATCYSLGNGKPVFSRLSPLMIDKKLPIDNKTFDIFARARILSTRGHGKVVSIKDVEIAKSAAPIITEWMNDFSPVGGRI